MHALKSAVLVVLFMTLLLCPVRQAGAAALRGAPPIADAVEAFPADPDESYAPGACPNLWNIRYFGCDAGGCNCWTLQRDGTPVCGDRNCRGAPNTCWGSTYTQASGSLNGISWSTSAAGALHLSHGQDYQVYGDTWLYTDVPVTLMVPFSADVGAVWLNDVNVTGTYAGGYIRLDLHSNANHVEFTSYNQNQGTSFRMDFPFASAVTMTCGRFCPADVNGSGYVDLDDYVLFVARFEAGTDNADFDGSGFVDLDDFVAFVHAFESGC